MPDSTWGILRYEKTLWMDGDGRRMYIGHFYKGSHFPGQSWEECSIRFWARKPRVALRTICQSGKDPAEFADKEIN